MDDRELDERLRNIEEGIYEIYRVLTEEESEEEIIEKKPDEKKISIKKKEIDDE